MPMKDSVEVAKETTRGMPMKREPMKGFIVIEAYTGIDRCYFLYLLKYILCKSPILSMIRS